ncbi:zinc finger protein 280D-like [Callospermophilus lateralis]|uniref:zinc finger protein 280D-like n=1 Tax=Callospermophilus lateralis TaxID=76772 RepID=UPI004053F745
MVLSHTGCCSNRDNTNVTQTHSKRLTQVQKQKLKTDSQLNLKKKKRIAGKARRVGSRTPDEGASVPLRALPSLYQMRALPSLPESSKASLGERGLSLQDTKKGIHCCTKCRLQFLTCKEKMDYKTQHHRTFIKPKQLEGLPPGTKVTIRASVGPLQSGSSPTPSINASTSTLQLSPPRTKNITAKNPTKSNTSKPNTTKYNANKPNGNKPNGSKSKYKSKISNMQKKQSTLANSNKKNQSKYCIEELKVSSGHSQVH